MRNQKGFSLVEAFILFVVLGLIAAAGMFIWNRYHQASPVNELPAVSSELKCPEGYKLAVQDDMKIRFCYPTDWSYEFGIDKYSSAKGVTMKSKDYEDQNCCYGGTAAGSRVYISAHQLGSGFYTVKEIFNYDNNQGGKAPQLTNQKAVKIAGKDGVSFYEAPYEGAISLVNDFENNNIAYHISIEQDITNEEHGPHFNNLDKYQKLIDSIQLIN